MLRAIRKSRLGLFMLRLAVNHYSKTALPIALRRLPGRRGFPIDLRLVDHAHAADREALLPDLHRGGDREAKGRRGEKKGGRRTGQEGAEDLQSLHYAKVGILAGSLVSGIVGFVVLRLSVRQQAYEQE